MGSILSELGTTQRGTQTNPSISEAERESEQAFKTDVFGAMFSLLLLFLVSAFTPHVFIVFIISLLLTSL